MNTKYKVGDILATKSNSFISKLIRYLSKSKYSHLALITSISETGIQLIEADGFYTKNIRYRNINDYINEAEVYTCDLTDKQRQDIVKYAISKIGQKYDYFLVFILFLKITFGIKIKIKDTDDDICSELVNDAYKSVGIELSKKRFPIPDDVLKEMKLSGSI